MKGNLNCVLGWILSFSLSWTKGWTTQRLDADGTTTCECQFISHSVFWSLLVRGWQLLNCTGLELQVEVCL